MFFNKYPYTDVSQLNLDYFLNEINNLKHPPVFEIPITWDENDNAVTTVTPNQYNKAVEDGLKPVITFTWEENGESRNYTVWTNTMDIDGLKVPDISYHMEPYGQTFFSIHFTWLDLDDPFTVSFNS